MARKSRGQHNHQTALANDATKDVSANQWNDVGSTPAHIESGMFGTLNSVSTVTLSTGALLPVDSYTVVQATGSPASDTLKNITNTNTNATDWLILTANAADTITVNHNDSGTGNIFLLGAINKTLSSTVPMILFRIGTNWYEFAITGTIVNANISATAAIAYGKLNLSGSILNADISNSAAISATKISGTAAVLNGSSAFIVGQTISPVLQTALLVNPPTGPTGSASSFHGGINIAAGTIAFATTAQTGDYNSSRIDQATLTNPSSGTITNAASLKIIGAPIASTNVTITNNYALWVAAGTARFDGGVQTSTLYDSNKNTAIAVTATSSAVNYLTVVNSATGNAFQWQLTGSDSNISGKFVPKGTGVVFGAAETMMIPMSDESTTAITTTGTKVTVYMPWAGSIAAVYQSANTAPTTSAITLDVLNNAGSTIFSTKPTIAAAANTGSNGVLTSTPTTFSQGDKLQFQVNTVDTGQTTKGLKMYLVIYRTS